MTSHALNLSSFIQGLGSGAAMLKASREGPAAQAARLRGAVSFFNRFIDARS